MNLGEMRDIVLAHVTRSADSLQVKNVNLVTVAINNALLFAERKLDLEWSKCEVSVECNPKGNILTGALDSNGSLVKVKKILQVLTAPESLLTLPYVSKDWLIRNHSGARDNLTPPAFQTKHTEGSSALCTAVVHEGPEISLYPQPSTLPYTIPLRVVKYLSPLVNPDDTNYLLEYGYDYITYKSVKNLNFFLKEDQRFAISDSMLNESFQSLDQWNAELVSPSEEETDL